MRLPRFRFTIRRMMILATVVALSCALMEYRRRRLVFLDRLAMYRFNVKCQVDSIANLKERLATSRHKVDQWQIEWSHAKSEGVSNDQAFAGIVRTAQRRVKIDEIRLRFASAEHQKFTRIVESYERAARYPWLRPQHDLSLLKSSPVDLRKELAKSSE